MATVSLKSTNHHRFAAKMIRLGLPQNVVYHDSAPPINKLDSLLSCTYDLDYLYFSCGVRVLISDVVLVIDGMNYEVYNCGHLMRDLIVIKFGRAPDFSLFNLWLNTNGE